MAFEDVAQSSLNYDDNIYDRETICYQTILRFHIWLKEMFPNSICFGLIENWDKSAAALISAVFVTREHVNSPKVF